MQMIITSASAVLTAITLSQCSLRRIQASAIRLMKLHIRSNFSYIVQQCRANHRNRPRAGLPDLLFRARFWWQQVALTQLDGNLQRMVQLLAGREC